jgi:hypothetical protein
LQATARSVWRGASGSEPSATPAHSATRSNGHQHPAAAGGFHGSFCQPLRWKRCPSGGGARIGLRSNCTFAAAQAS